MNTQTLQFAAEAIDAKRCADLPQLYSKSEALKWVADQLTAELAKAENESPAD